MTSCAVCNSDKVIYLASKNNFIFNQCTDCDFTFLDPMPVQEELNNQYTDNEKEVEPTYDKASSRLRRAFLKLPRFFPYAFNKDTLDLGCGGGFIAHVLSIIANTSIGIDINEKAIAYAKNKFKRPIYLCKNFSELLDEQKQYDFIYSSEVIEHISDVNIYMRILQKLTRTGGYVYITTPDLGHPKVPANINDWDVFTPPVHVQFFSKKTVVVLFQKYGFKILKFYRNKKPGLIFLSRKI